MSIRPSPRNRALAALLAAVVLVSVPAGATASGALAGEASLLRHEGMLREHGSLALLRMHHEDSIQAPLLHLEAASGYALHFDQDFLLAADARIATRPAQPTDWGSPEDPYHDIRLRSLGAKPLFDIRVVPLEEATLSTMVRGATELAAWEDARMDDDGIRRTDPSDPEGSEMDETQYRFVTKIVDHPVLVSHAVGGVGDVRIEGDFLLEFIGLDVGLQAKERAEEVFVTEYTENGYGESGEPVLGVANKKLLRIVVQDAHLVLRHDGPGRLMEWAATETAVEGDDGLVTLQAFRSALGSQAQEQQVRFPAGYTGSLAPGEDSRFSVDLSGSRDPYVPTASMWLPPTGFNPIPIAAALLLVALVALATRSVHRSPPLEHMENALEAGAFSRAARLAGRILRHDPHKESAHLGRAIALSRSGRPERVVRDLKPFLEHNDPSDGTLHYVLGLAYRDLGKEAAATEALSEAVRRTPALAQQVPDVPAPVEPRRRAPEGDAQGYT